MPKIETYVLATQPLSFSDMLIGTEVNGPIPNATKNFSLGELYNLFATLPNVGDLQSTLNAGNTATQNIFLTGNIESTTVKPQYIIDTLSSTGAVGEVLLRSVSGIVWAGIPVPNLQQVLNSGNSATQNISLIGNITATKVIPGNIEDGTGSIGSVGQVLYKSSIGIIWANPSAGSGTVTSVQLAAGAGISLSGTNPITTSGTITIVNSAPDLVVSLTAGAGIGITGTYPNFTISNTQSLSGYVPYTGATSDVDLGTHKLTADAIAFSLTPTNSPGQGQIAYVGSTGALAYIMDASNVICQIGQQLYAYVTNDDAVTITKGQPVYLFGATGNRATVKLAANTSDATSAKTLGLAAENIASGQKGFIICQGVLDGLNTGTYNPGDTLYVGPTAGSLTAVKPYAPNHLVYIGVVERANNGNGQIYVRPQNGYELDEIHDVDLITTPPVNNDVLTYVTGANNLWKPRSISSILGYTPVSGTGTTNYLPKWSSATGLSNSQIFDNGSQIDFLNSTRTVLSILGAGLSINSVSALNDADSYSLNFNAIGSSGNAQSAYILLDGNGGLNGAAFIIRNNNGSVNLSPSNGDVWLPINNTRFYAALGGIIFQNNSTSDGFTFGNGGNQSTGNLFQIINNYNNVGQIYPFTVFANGNILLGSATQTNAGYKLDVGGTTRLNGNSTVNGTLGVGAATPNASSLVEMVSTSSGLLIPRMTTAQINAISSPAQGLMAYSTDENVLYYYDSDFGAWWSDNVQWRAKNGIDVFEDFLGGYSRGTLGNPYSPLFMLRTANSGLIRQAAGGSNRSGVINFSTSTTSNAQTGVYTDDINGSGYLLGGGKILVEIDIQVPTLSDGTNTFRWWGGFSNNVQGISGAGVSSLCFFYDSQNAFGYGASNNWQLMASNNNVRTVTVTSVPVTAGQWYRLRMVINANATLCDFTIDGVLVKSENTNIPATTIQLGLGCNLIKSAGVAERNIWIDYYRIKQKFTTQR